MTDSGAPPRAPARPVELTAHDDVRVDPWHWLRDREDPAVLAHLEAENAYTAAVLEPTRGLQERLFEEIRGRIQETDASPPAHLDRWDYFSRTYEGRQYAVHGRRPRGAPAGTSEVVLLDENVLAGDSEYFALGGFELSSDHGLLAYSTDSSGGERLTLRVRDLETGADRPDVVDGVYYGLAWSADAGTLFYIRPDEAVRPFQLWRHTMGTSVARDVLVYEEEDERYFVSVGRTRTGDLVVLTIESKTTSEVRFLAADDPTGELRVVEPRRQGVEYQVAHHRSAAHGDRLFVLTNADGAADFSLRVTPLATPGREHWEVVLPHRAGTRLEAVDAFAGHLVVSERAGGLEQLRVLDLGAGPQPAAAVPGRVLGLPDPVYSVWSGENLEFDTATFRFGYTSLVVPASAYDENLDSGSRTLVKRTPVLGGYDPADYTSARLWATADDGTRVPISVVHRNDVARDGRAPCVLYGYGSYEHSIDPAFSSIRLSLLDRGFVFAIAHVRGGGELGRQWYEEGKLTAKRNTFTDFVACAEHLVAEGYTTPDRLGARGGSAGGLLMGAVVNLRPELFGAVVAEVPFVDALTTMLDPTLPLTVIEWEEWGDPLHDPEAYAYMKSYSPYDNVRPAEYPAMLVTAGLNDPRVSYWEPAKWVAKLRATKRDDRPLLLKTELGAGHGGPSGRYDAWRDEAMVLAFLIDQLTGGTDR
jgi:oligopeptidase B